MPSLSPDPRDGGDPQNITLASTTSLAAAIPDLTNRLERLRGELQAIEDTLGALTSRAEERAHALPPSEHLDPGTACSTPVLRLYCFGPFEVFIGHRPVRRRHTGKGWAIMKVLASRLRQPVHREELIEIVWPQTDPAIASNRLRVAIHHLRRALQPLQCGDSAIPALLYHDGCYEFGPSLEVWCDVEVFWEAWQTGQRAEREQRHVEAAAHYRDAAAVYRGDYFAEDRFEEWTLLPREQISDAYLGILDWLASHALASGDIEAAIEHWRLLITCAPWREEGYRGLMIAYTRNGQRSQALHWYAQCRRILAEQLGAPPEPETVLLAEQICESGRMGRPGSLR